MTGLRAGKAQAHELGTLQLQLRQHWLRWFVRKVSALYATNPFSPSAASRDASDRYALCLLRRPPCTHLCFRNSRKTSKDEDHITVAAVVCSLMKP